MLDKCTVDRETSSIFLILPAQTISPKFRCELFWWNCLENFPTPFFSIDAVGFEPNDSSLTREWGEEAWKCRLNDTWRVYGNDVSEGFWVVGLVEAHKFNDERNAWRENKGKDVILQYIW